MSEKTATPALTPSRKIIIAQKRFFKTTKILDAGRVSVEEVGLPRWGRGVEV